LPAIVIVQGSLTTTKRLAGGNSPASFIVGPFAGTSVNALFADGRRAAINAANRRRRGAHTWERLCVALSCSFCSCGKACQKAHWSAGHKYGCTSGWCGVGVPKADLGGGEAQAEPTRDDTELNERLRVWALTKGITKCKFMDGDDDDPLVA